MSKMIRSTEIGLALLATLDDRRRSAGIADGLVRKLGNPDTPTEPLKR